MARDENAPAPREPDDRVSKELLLRYLAAKAAKRPLASLPVPADHRELPGEEPRAPA